MDYWLVFFLEHEFVIHTSKIRVRLSSACGPTSPRLPPSLNTAATIFGYTPEKLTNVPLKWDHFSREYIFQPLIFMGHSLVFRGGTLPSPPVLRNATSFELGDEGGLRHHRWIPLSFGEGYEAKRKKSKRYYLPHDVAKWWIHMVESTN